jgi:hypothetical protein
MAVVVAVENQEVMVVLVEPVELVVVVLAVRPQLEVMQLDLVAAEAAAVELE